MADFLHLSTSTVFCCKLVIVWFRVFIWRWCLRAIWNILLVQNAIVRRVAIAVILGRTTHLSNQNFMMVPAEETIQTPTITITTRGTVIRLLYRRCRVKARSRSRQTPVKVNKKLQTLSIQKRTEPSSVYNKR